MFRTRTNVIIANWSCQVSHSGWADWKPLFVLTFMMIHTLSQVSIDYVQDAHRHHLEGMCRDEYYLVLSNK